MADKQKCNSTDHNWKWGGITDIQELVSVAGGSVTIPGQTSMVVLNIPIATFYCEDCGKIKKILIEKE